MMTTYDIYKGDTNVGTVTVSTHRGSFSSSRLVNTFGTRATEGLSEEMAEGFITHARIDWPVVDVVEAGETDCPWRLVESSEQPQV
jgi:hypothetical protein